MQVSEVLNRNAIVLDMDAADKASAIEGLAGLLFKDGAISSTGDFVADVYAREAEGKTGIGGGVAIPHGKSASVKRTCVAIARLRKPIEWETLDGQPVRLIIMFAVGLDDKGSTFVKLMSQVARKLASEEVCDRLMTGKTVDEMVAVFAD